MAEIKDYIWLCPFIGAVLTGISLFTPAAYDTSGSSSLFIWMNGFTVITGGVFGPKSGFFAEPLGGEIIPGYIIPGTIATIFLIAFTIALFVSSLTHRHKETPGSWIALGILLFVGAIVYIAGVEIGVGTYFYNQGAHYHVSFWDDFGFNPGFAVIAPFIGGTLALIGAIVGKAISKQEIIGKPKVIPQVEKPAPVTQAPAPAPISTAEEAKVVRFCPECGTKVEQEGATFCSVCGHKF
jgi:hypothetical protein